MPILFSPRFTRVCQAPPIHFLNVTFPQKLSMKIVNRAFKKAIVLFKNLKNRLFLCGLSSQKLELVTDLVHEIWLSGIRNKLKNGFRQVEY